MNLPRAIAIIGLVASVLATFVAYQAFVLLSIPLMFVGGLLYSVGFASVLVLLIMGGHGAERA